MIRRHRHLGRTATGDVGVNLTPMIDCTLLLIVFFILTSQMVSESLVRLRLHRPLASQALTDDSLLSAPNKVIVNVLSAAGEGGRADTADPAVGAALRYQVASTRIPPGPAAEAQLRMLLARHRERARREGFEEFFVEIRADRRVAYGQVSPVMRAARDAGIGRMNITALTGSPEEP